VDALGFHLSSICKKISIEISKCLLEKENNCLPSLLMTLTTLQCDCVKGTADPSFTAQKELCLEVGEFSLHSLTIQFIVIFINKTHRRKY